MCKFATSSCKFVPFNPYCASVPNGPRGVCYRPLQGLGGKAHTAQPRVEGARTDNITPHTWTHSRSWTCTRRFPPVKTQSWKVRRSGTYSLIQKNSAGIPCGPAQQGGHGRRPPPHPGPKPPPHPPLEAATRPSPLPTQGPGLRPFSTALSFVRGRGPPRSRSKRPPLEYDPRASVCQGS